jgi:adenylate cyclase
MKRHKIASIKQANEFIEVRVLDILRVVERSTPIKIYELLGKNGAIEASIKKILPLFNQGLMNYQNHEWDEAKRCFENTLMARPEDGPQKSTLSDETTSSSPPPADDWDGVFNLSTK